MAVDPSNARGIAVQQDRHDRRWRGVRSAVDANRGPGSAASPPAFDDWVASRGPALLRLAYVLTGSQADAEDVVQDALARALPRWHRIGRVEDVDAYVRRMVVNAHVSWWRRFRRRESPVAEVRTTGTAPDPGEGLWHDDRRRIWAACSALPEAQRTAIVLRYYEQLEYDEIAALTDVREGTVRSRVSRGIAVLRRELGETDE